MVYTAVVVVLLGFLTGVISATLIYGVVRYLTPSTSIADIDVHELNAAA